MPLALVTGAGIRIGEAVALELAQAGFDLVLHANRSRAQVEAVAEQVRALGRKAFVELADLSSDAGQDALAAQVRAQHGALDVLVHNAGLFEQIPFDQIDRAKFRRMLSVNLEAPFFLTQALLPLLHAAEAPCVVHLTDIGGERPILRYSHYSVSKAGLIMLTRALAVELAPKVRVNAISPGTVIFPEDFDEATRERFLKRIPLHREGSAQDVAKAVRFLVCDAPYVTGQVLAVDGGRSSVL